MEGDGGVGGRWRAGDRDGVALGLGGGGGGGAGAAGRRSTCWVRVSVSVRVRVRGGQRRTRASRPPCRLGRVGVRVRANFWPSSSPSPGP